MDKVLSLFSFFVAGALGGWTLTFAARALALKYGVLAQPSARRKHQKPTPLLGGLGIYSVLLLALAYTAWKSDSTAYIVAFIVAVSMVLAVGIVDDWVELKAAPKFLTQFAAAALILAFEPNLPKYFAEYGISGWIGYPIAWLWIVGVTNAMNLIDGLDGLCSGIAVLTALAIAVLAPSAGVGAILAPALGGAAAGFLVHNYTPARIFLGDSGSLLLGFSLAVLSFHIPAQSSAVLSLGVLALLFGLPVLDTFLAVYRRVSQGKPVFTGDRSHLHHRLVNLGVSARASFLVLIAVQAYAAVAGVVLQSGAGGWASVALALPFAALFLYGLRFTEYLLSYQSARLSYLFLSDELERLADRERVIAFVKEQVERYDLMREGFSVVVMDCSKYLPQIVAESPMRLVRFYVSLYGTLKARLRHSDLISRPSEMQFAIVLPGAWEIEGRHSPIFDFLGSELGRLQEEYGIYRTDPRSPEGFRILTYPRDRAKIWKALGLQDASSRTDATVPETEKQNAA